MTNLNLYRVFCEVAKQQNITKASEALYISQPAVSSAIKELENELGGQLFVRQNKGVVLSSYGQDIYNKIKPCVEKLNDIDNYFEDIKALQNGLLRIGSNTSNTNQIISNYLVKFASLYPNVKIQMKRADKNQLIDDLSNQKLDIIYIDDENIAGFKVIESYDIFYNLIGNKEFMEKYKDNPITLENLEDSELILTTNNNTSRKIIDRYMSEFDIKLKPKYEVDDYKVLYELVKKGLGIAFVNTDYYKNKIDKEVYLINSSIKLQARKINAVVNRHANNPTLTQFIDVILD